MSALIEFSETGHQIRADISFQEAWSTNGLSGLKWINISGTSGEDFDNLVQTLDLHPLLVEDLKNKSQLPKFESFDNVSFMSLQMLRRHRITKSTFSEHVSILIRGNSLITVQEDVEGDVFDHVRQKIQVNFKRLAKNGIDYLFLSVVDAVVDEYLSVMDSFRIPMEDLEMVMVKRPVANVMKTIMELKTEMNRMRRISAPLREEMQRIRTENPELIKKQNQVLFRDIIDHLNTMIYNFDNFREILRDLTDLHQSNQNLMLNNTMKTLTVISAIFIPLTFVVGVYGMNFDFMPELHWKYGYAVIWLAMLTITGGLIWYMRKKRWF
ncbi:MAG: magnesium/cobalt transporter CorA [Bacteroidetes bacterium]|nr:magnesium/cobalt transporter CorA [Bacteroidota bacterium]